MASGKKKPAKKKVGKKPNPGIRLEKAVARIQQMLDPDSKVTHNETLTDRLDNKRQFDVVVRGTFAGHAVLGVVECKDHGRKKNPDAVDAFAKKCDNLGADLKIMVSRLGFTKQALKVANHENIRCLSLLPGDYDQTGLTLKVTFYARIWSWADFTLSLVPHPDIPDITANDVLLDGKTVLELFDKDLEENYPTYTTLGPVRRIIECGSSLTLDIKGQCVVATALRFKANRICTVKRKEIQYFGDGVYDWQKAKWTVPDRGRVFTEAWKADFSGWDDFSGPIPPEQSRPFVLKVDVFVPPRMPLSSVSDYELRALSERPPTRNQESGIKSQESVGDS
jgi:hypothetical protein